MRRLAGCVVLVPLLVLLAGCGREGRGTENGENGASNLSGSIRADGSSTVGPLTTAAAERFRRTNPRVRITVGISGTGGGFERFCNGETDLSNASRAIKEEEQAACDKNGIDYVEFLVANDGIAVVVNNDNTWAMCLTVAQLKKIWQPGSKVKNWKDVDPKFPDVGMKLYGAGTDSGTFDFFTDQINGEEGASRSDYSATENDNVTVQGVSGDRGALGYFGLSYFEENQQRLKALEIDGGDGCVAPSTETVQNGTYEPLARPLFVYAKRASLRRPEVEAFLRFIVANEREIATGARFVPLTDAQEEQAKRELERAVGAS
jgi:phosphate transport system substrate-binding protein